MQNAVVNKLFNMEKLCCCFSSTSDGPALDVELKCAITCCVNQARNIDVDMVDGSDDKEEVKDESSLCCFKCTKERCKQEVDQESENG